MIAPVHRRWCCRLKAWSSSSVDSLEARSGSAPRRAESLPSAGHGAQRVPLHQLVRGLARHALAHE